MSLAEKPEPKPRFADKKRLQEVMDAVNKKLGIVHDPTAIAEKAQEMALADGVNPADNALTREIIALREES